MHRDGGAGGRGEGVGVFGDPACGVERSDDPGADGQHDRVGAVGDPGEGVPVGAAQHGDLGADGADLVGPARRGGGADDPVPGVGPLGGEFHTDVAAAHDDVPHPHRSTETPFPETYQKSFSLRDP
jgi:hypothetical protein